MNSQNLDFQEEIGTHQCSQCLKEHPTFVEAQSCCGYQPKDLFGDQE